MPESQFDPYGELLKDQVKRAKELQSELNAMETKPEYSANDEELERDIKDLSRLGTLVTGLYQSVHANDDLRNDIALEWFRFNFCSIHPNAGVRRADLMLSVTECPGCGGNHARLPFLRLDSPIGEYTHWTPCPQTGEPVFVNEEEEG